MTSYVTFDGTVETMLWGTTTYTILRVPNDLVGAIGPTKRVEGEINDHPINLALTKAPVIDGTFLWAGQSLLTRIGIVPGEKIEVRLRPAPDDRVDVADDVSLALRTVMDVWSALTPGKQRGLLYQIDTAKTPATRAKRIAKLVESLQ